MVIKSILTAMFALILVSCTALGYYFENYANTIKRSIEYDVRNKGNIDESFPYMEDGVFKRKKQSIDSKRYKWLFESNQGCKVEYITDKEGFVLSGKIISSNKSCEDSKGPICWHCS